MGPPNSNDRARPTHEEKVAKTPKVPVRQTTRNYWRAPDTPAQVVLSDAQTVSGSGSPIHTLAPRRIERNGR